MLTDPSYAVLSTMSRVAGPFTRCPGDKLPAIRDWEPRATTDPDRIRIRRCLDGGAGQRRVGVWACRPRRGRPLLREGYPRVARSLPQFADQAGGLLGGEVGEVAAGDGGGDGGQCDRVGVGHPAGLVVGLEFGFEVEQERNPYTGSRVRLSTSRNRCTGSAVVSRSIRARGAPDRLR